ATVPRVIVVNHGPVLSADKFRLLHVAMTLMFQHVDLQCCAARFCMRHAARHIYAGLKTTLLPPQPMYSPVQKAETMVGKPPPHTIAPARGAPIRAAPGGADRRSSVLGESFEFVAS